MSEAYDNPAFSSGSTDGKERTERDFRSQNRTLRAKVAELEARLEQITSQTDPEAGDVPVDALAEALKRLWRRQSPRRRWKDTRRPRRKCPCIEGRSTPRHHFSLGVALWNACSRHSLVTDKSSLLDRVAGFEQGKLSILEFIAQFKQLMDALEISGVPMCDEMRVKMFVENLAPNYKAQAQKYLLDYPTIHGVYGSSGVLPMFSGLTTYLVQWSSTLAASDSVSVNYVAGKAQ
eukprot:jgi/Picre1/33400/NNA_008724.t1